MVHDCNPLCILPYLATLLHTVFAYGPLSTPIGGVIVVADKCVYSIHTHSYACMCEYNRGMMMSIYCKRRRFKGQHG